MNKNSFLRYGVPVIFISLVLVLLYLVRTILLPFVLAFIFAYLVNPVVTYFESRGFRRDLALVGMYLFVVVFVAGIALLVTPFIRREMKEFKSSLPVIEQKVNSFIDKSAEAADKVVKGDKPLKETIMPKLEEFKKEQIGKIPDYLGQAANFFSNMFLVFFIGFFVLLSSRKIIRDLVNSLAPKYVETVLSLICEVDVVLGNFIRGTMIESTCVALISMLGLWYIKIDYFFVLGPLAGFGNVIPYLGPVIGAVPSAIIGVLQYNNITIVLKVAAVFITVQLLDNWIIQPIAVGSSVSLNTLEVLIVMLIGAELFGTLGLLLAVPVGASLKIAFGILYARYIETLEGQKIEELELKTRDLI